MIANLVPEFHSDALQACSMLRAFHRHIHNVDSIYEYDSQKGRGFGMCRLHQTARMMLVKGLRKSCGSIRHSDCLLALMCHRAADWPAAYVF